MAWQPAYVLFNVSTPSGTSLDEWAVPCGPPYYVGQQCQIMVSYYNFSAACGSPTSGPWSVTVHVRYANGAEESYAGAGLPTCGPSCAPSMSCGPQGTVAQAWVYNWAPRYPYDVEIWAEFDGVSSATLSGPVYYRARVEGVEVSSPTVQAAFGSYTVVGVSARVEYYDPSAGAWLPAAGVPVVLRQLWAAPAGACPISATAYTNSEGYVRFSVTVDRRPGTCLYYDFPYVWHPYPFELSVSTQNPGYYAGPAQFSIYVVPAYPPGLAPPPSRAPPPPPARAPSATPAPSATAPPAAPVVTAAPSATPVAQARPSRLAGYAAVAAMAAAAGYIIYKIVE